MANVNAYKALGTSLGKYRKNLTDIDKSSIKSDLLSFEYSQDRAMTDTLARTIAEVSGIVAEKIALNRDLDLGKKSAGVYSSKEEYQPLGKFGKFIGLDAKERKVFKSREGDLTLDPKTLAQIGIMERLGLSNKYSDFDLDAYYDKQGFGESEVLAASIKKEPVSATMKSEPSLEMDFTPETFSTVPVEPSKINKQNSIEPTFGPMLDGYKGLRETPISHLNTYSSESFDYDFQIGNPHKVELDANNNVFDLLKKFTN